MSRNKLCTEWWLSDVCWFHGDRRLQDSDDCLTSQSGNMHKIVLFNTDISKTGLYSLAAVNKQGELWHSWHVTIEGSLHIFYLFNTNLLLRCFNPQHVSIFPLWSWHSEECRRRRSVSVVWSVWLPRASAEVLQEWKTTSKQWSLQNR